MGDTGGGAAVVEEWPVGWGMGVCRPFVVRIGGVGVGCRVRKGSGRVEECRPGAGSKGVGMSENAHFFVLAGPVSGGKDGVEIQ